MTYNIAVAPLCGTTFVGPTLAEACPGSQFLLFMTMLDNVIRAKEDVAGSCDRVTPVKTIADEYDFIVVGGGGAGAVAAARLSEIKDWKVLLIEAGHDEPPGTSVPSYMIKMLGTELDWQFQSTNETGGCQSTGGTCQLAAGKVLGGSTVLNAMIYLRGVPKDFEKWVALGNDGWSWDEVEPFYMKSEDNGEIDRVGRKHHATGGPLNVERFPWVPEIHSDIFEAARELGYNVSEDLNGDVKSGFTIVQSTNKNGVRESTAKAFLRPARNRRNLDIALNSIVTRIIFDNVTAIGVEYLRNGQLHTTYASREVVLSAGAVKSPHILLLSGVGPKKQLQSFNIPVVKDLPGVGGNLHDHPELLIPFTIDEPDANDLNWVTISEYLAFNTGPMASNGMNQVTWLYSTNRTTDDYPDGQVFFVGYNAFCATTGEAGALKSDNNRTLTVIVTNLHPISKGSVSLASGDPLDRPKMTVKYLQDPEEIETMLIGIEKALALTKAKGLAKHNMTLNIEPTAACSEYPPLSREFWICFMRHNMVSAYHLAGTCKMGPHRDSLAVVDPRLRVHGMKGLRVADASIIPELTSGNAMAPCIMIGERVADFIKNDHGIKHQASTSTLSFLCSSMFNFLILFNLYRSYNDNKLSFI